MREQLSGIENKGIRAKAEKIVEAVSDKLDEAKGALGNLKRAFLGKVDQALQAGKTKKAGRHWPESFRRFICPE